MGTNQGAVCMSPSPWLSVHFGHEETQQNEVTSPAHTSSKWCLNAVWFKVHVALTVNSDIPVASTRSPPWAWAVHRQKTHPSEISPLIDGNKLCFLLISLLYIEPKFASGQISSHWTTQSKFLALPFHRPSDTCQQLSWETTNTEPASMWLIC